MFAEDYSTTQSINANIIASIGVNIADIGHKTSNWTVWGTTLGLPGRSFGGPVYPSKDQGNANADQERVCRTPSFDCGAFRGDWDILLSDWKMQVHAVPEDECAFDSSGRRLPWGYLYADDNLNKKQPIEKGPFGRPTNRRSMSRSKTATPATKEDILKLEHDQFVDGLFNKIKQDAQKEKSTREYKPPSSSSAAQLAVTHVSTTDATSLKSTVPAGPQPHQFKEPTEVIIYGYGDDHMPSALDFYERASNGRIYEDYERQPTNSRYNTALSAHRAVVPRTLPAAAIRRIRTYEGGDYWIKVTFDSPEAAELACHYSPHVIQGYLVHAEFYRGVKPTRDAAIPATTSNKAGAFSLHQRRAPHQAVNSFASLPSRIQSAHIPGPSADLASSASSETADGIASAATSSTDYGNPQSTVQQRQVAQNKQPAQQSLRVVGATRAVLRPATEAFPPLAPWSQRAFGHWPLIGAFFGGEGSTGDFIGSGFPRKEDGSFDWNNASLWWRTCFTIDSWLGTDICGIRGDD